MKSRKYINILITSLLALLVFCNSSCSDFLDVVPDNTATIHHAFKKRVQAEAYLYGIYGFLPNFSSPAENPAFLAGEESWLFEEFRSFNNSAWKIAAGQQGTQETLCNFWAAQSNSAATYAKGGLPIFTGISDCNVFLENIHNTIDLDEFEREMWIAEVKFLKAFFHFWLLQAYGPVPIIDKNVGVGTSTEGVMFHREPVDDVVNYIVGLLDEASTKLPLNVTDVTQDMGRITRPIALAVKAKVLTFAASPLFNGNPDYINITDNRGIKLFPQSYDATKWEKAADALKEAIDVCHEANYELFDFSKLPEAAMISNETLLTQQAKGAATERWNNEIIWGCTKDVSALQRFGLPAFVFWNSYSAAYRSWAPTIATVKQFYTKNGVPIEEDKDWTAIDLYDFRAADNSHQYYIAPGTKTINLHFDREARFYGAIGFDGGKYYGLGTMQDNNMRNIDIITNGLSWSADVYSVTGYLAKKMVNRYSSLDMTSSGSVMYRYAFPTIRLADLYLLYAEVLNEIRILTDDEVHDYIDVIRIRSGLEGVKDSWAKYSTNPDKPLSQEGMREIIHRERMIELAFEGQRFWDLRRWKKQKEYMNKPVQGWDIYSREIEGFYREPQTLAVPNFQDKDYLWPIPQVVLIKNKNLIQNPGWD